jgi:hypothetical protein
MISGQPPPIDWLPAESNAWNAGAFTALDEDDPSILAKLFEEAVGSLIAASREHGSDDACPYYAVYGGQFTVGILCVVQINEYLLHWADMAFAVGRDWSCPESAAETVFTILAPILIPLFFDSSAAGDLNASFALEAPGVRLAYRARSGDLEALDEEIDCDCSISGPASRWLLWLTGRVEWDDRVHLARGPRAELSPRFADSFPSRGA